MTLFIENKKYKRVYILFYSFEFIAYILMALKLHANFLLGYGPVISVNRPVRRRMPGGVGAGGAPPATQLGQLFFRFFLKEFFGASTLYNLKYFSFCYVNSRINRLADIRIHFDAKSAR